jgi:formimidoylglutamate deiminase
VQINLWEDLRQLEYHLRLKHLQRNILADDLAATLFRIGTAQGYQALGLSGGEFQPGMWADFVTVDLNDLSLAGSSPQTLLTQMVFSLERTAIRRVYVGGEEVYSEGHHRKEDPIIRDFQKLQTKLKDILI